MKLTNFKKYVHRTYLIKKKLTKFEKNVYVIFITKKIIKLKKDGRTYNETKKLLCILTRWRNEMGRVVAFFLIRKLFQIIRLYIKGMRNGQPATHRLAVM